MSFRPLYVSFTSPNTKTVAGWRAAGKNSALSNARAWAAERGAAFVIRMDGSGTLYYSDDGRIRQRSWRDVRPAPVPSLPEDLAWREKRK